MPRTPPKLIEVNAPQLEELLQRAQGKLDEKDYELMRAVFESYVYVSGVVGDKNTSIRRLRKLLFGAPTEKTRAVTGRDNDASGPESEDSDASPDDPPDESSQTPGKKGHGRNGADAYRGAEQVDVPHASLHPGDPCPECRQGKVYEVAQPGVLVRVVGQAPLHATVYRLQKLRCHLCGRVFTAQPPEKAGARKYDATAASMIALLKYGCGMPFNRLGGLQRGMKIPLPASTQWDVLMAFAPFVVPAWEALIAEAADGDVLYHDDTGARILEFMGKRAKQQAFDDDPLAGRTGLFTSGVVSTRQGRQVALFFSGRQHAGENLADVLQHRAAALKRPIQMCDALSRNMPAELKTIVANCLAHGRRQFVDVADRFPDECEYVLEALKIVYGVDAKARKQKLSPDQRLALHQAESQPVMTRLQEWFQQQFDERLVEPNSALGEAIGYMQKHWAKLTRFLTTPGAPLDNNICERALKKAIQHRKNALFYKTENGARVGDMYMSLIYTCQLCQVSPFDYLTALHRHGDRVALAPDRWLPWNYHTALD